jgi:hypothetical protein
MPAASAIDARSRLIFCNLPWSNQRYHAGPVVDASKIHGRTDPVSGLWGGPRDGKTPHANTRVPQHHMTTRQLIQVGITEQRRRAPESEH